MANFGRKDDRVSSATAYTIHIVIILALQFFFRFLTPFNGLSELSMQIIGVFLGTMYGWVFIGQGMPSVFGMVALALTDYTNINGVIKNGFGDPTVGLIIVLFLITAYVEHAGLHTKIVNFMLSRKFLQGHPWLFIVFFLLTVFTVNIASQQWLSILFFIDLIRDMCGKTGMKPKSKQASSLTQMTIMVAILSSMCLPIKDQPISRMAVYTAATGETINSLSYTLVALPLGLILILAIILVAKFILRMDFSCLTHIDVVDVEQVSLNREQRTAVKFLLALFVAMIIPGFLPKSFPVIGHLGSTGCAYAVLAALLLFRQNGKQIITLKDVGKYVNWNVIIQLSILFPLMSALGSKEVGLNALISSKLTGLMGLSPFMFAFAVVLISGLLTQVMNNGVCAALFISTMCMMSDVLPAGINLAGLTILIAFSTDMSCWLPSSTAAVAYTYAQTDIVEFKYFFWYGLVQMIAALLVIGTVGFKLMEIVM